MKNYGILVTPIGLLILAPGIAFINMGAPEYVAIPIMVVGGLLFVMGLARLVQGKNRKIFGQVVRPKAAARSSAIWSLFFVNLMPLVLNNTTIFENIDGPPFPLAILTSGSNIISLGYDWLPFVFPLFLLIWLLGLIFSKKIPKIVYIFNMFMIILSITFWMNFGVMFLLWTLTADKTNLPLMTDAWKSAAHFTDLLVPFGIGIGIIILTLIIILRLLKNLQKGFSHFNVKNSFQRVFSFIMMSIIYLVSISPLIFGILNSLEPVGYIASFMNYIPIIFIAIAILNAVTSLINSAKEFARQQAGSSSQQAPNKIGLMSAVLMVILFIAWAPIILPLVDAGQNNKNNSAYNTDWNGWSNFRQDLEGIYGSDNIMNIESSISTIGQLDPTKQIILVVAGPNKFYNPASEIPYFLNAFKGNFSMFICDDHGSTGSLLNEMFIASFAANGMDGASPLTFFPKGILHENTTGKYWRDPVFPIISDFRSHDITSGVSKVVLGHATAFLGGDLLAGLGWSFLGYTSGTLSYVDVNNDGMYNSTQDTFPFPGDIGSLLATQDNPALQIAGTLLDVGIPLGGYPQAVFSYKQLSLNTQVTVNNRTAIHSGRVFCATDATWLDNELYSISEFDNKLMGLQAMQWLACGRNPSDTIIVFDEAHILPESGMTLINSATTFGITQGYINWLSTNPVIGLIYPLLALSTLRKWIPKEKYKQKIQLKELEDAEKSATLLKFRTSSFFAQKINWYRTKKKYKPALLQLYRRVQRKINRMLGDSGDRSVDAIMNAIQRERGSYISKSNYKRFEKFFDFMNDLKRNKTKVKDVEDFENAFLEMMWVSDHL